MPTLRQGLRGFAAAGLALATGGVLGVGAYLAGRRVPELGLRAALGATRAALVGLLLRDGSRPVVLGVLLGVLAALLLGDAWRGLLFGVDARDPRVLWGAPAFLVGLGLAAHALPALRASAVDPMRAPRDE